MPAGGRVLPAPSPRWYALAVHVRSELVSARDLRERGFETFVPAQRERRAWSDRVVTHEVPLFPGYVFVRVGLDAARRVELLKVRAVRDLVGRVPGDVRVARAIDDDEMDDLRRVAATQVALDPVERLICGRHVLIAAGPLRGIHGIVETGPDGLRRLVVQIALLGRGVRATLSADDVVETVDDAA